MAGPLKKGKIPATIFPQVFSVEFILRKCKLLVLLCPEYLVPFKIHWLKLLLSMMLFGDGASEEIIKV